jgi:tetratricopeptide (TPR) repeat protein
MAAILRGDGCAGQRSRVSAAGSAGASIWLVRRALGLSLASVLAAASFAWAQARNAPGETAAAREQARLCERLAGAPGVDACRLALTLGIAEPRRTAVRVELARRLAALEDWDALADHLRESTKLQPQDAEAWRRLGLVLLFPLHQTAEAVNALSEAVRLAPQDAEARAGLAQALAVSGRFADAAAAFAEALRLDPAVLDGRPAARAAYDAARRGAGWP